jgi:hypothetical protein
LTLRRSTVRETPGRSAATAAKPVMLRIMGCFAQLYARFLDILVARDCRECMRYPPGAQAGTSSLAHELRAFLSVTP